MDYANTTNVEFIVDPGFHTGPGHIIKFQDIAKQINNFERTWSDRNKINVKKFLEKLNCFRRYSTLKCNHVSKNSNKMAGNSKIKA